MDNTVSDNQIGVASATVGGIVGVAKKIFATKLDPPPGFTQVCMEDETVNFAYPVDVAFGANGKFLYKRNVTGSIQFSRAYFGGDPIKKKKKGGYAKALVDSTLGLVSSPATGGKETEVVKVDTAPNNFIKQYGIYIVGAVLVGLVIYLLTKN